MIIALKYPEIMGYRVVVEYINSDHIVSFWDHEVDNEKFVYIMMVNDTNETRLRRFAGFAHSTEKLSAETLYNKIEGRV